MNATDRETRVLTGLLVTALALRVVHVLTIRDYPLFDVLSLDSESYDRWAREIAAGQWLRDRPFYQAPLYAYFLAGLHTLTGGDLLAPRLVNALLGTANVGLVFLLGKRAFGSNVGVLAAAMVALHGTFLFEEGKVMKTTLGVTLASATLVLLLEGKARRSTWWFVAAGFLGGLTALVRENFALFVVAVVVLALLRNRRAQAGALAVGAALAILPSTLHNFLASGEFIPITSQAGQNFYTGVHRGNDGGGYLVPDFVRRSPRFEEIDFAREATLREHRELSAGEVSRYWLGESRDLLVSDPLRFPRLLGRKLGLLFRNDEIPDDEDLRFFRRYAPVLRLPLLGFGVIALFGFGGLALAAVRRRGPAELFLFVAVYTVSVASFFVFSRYRLPLVAPLAVFAASLVSEGWSAVRSRNWRPVGITALALVPFALFVFRPLPGIESFANSHLSMGIAHEVKERWGDAIMEYDAGLAIEPEHRKLLKRAARLRLIVGEGSVPTAADLAFAARAVAANPDEIELRFRYATALAQIGRATDAIAEYEEILREGQEPPGIHANLALLYHALDQKAQAVEHAKRALARAPGDPVLREIAQGRASEE